MLGIVDFGADQDPMGDRIDGRPDGGNPALEHATRMGHDGDPDVLPDAEGRAVAFRDIRQHPHGRDVGDRKRRLPVAGLDQKSGSRIAGRDPAGDRAWHHERRVGHALGHDPVNLRVGLAENADGVPCRPQCAFGGLLIGGRLLYVLLGHGSRFS